MIFKSLEGTIQNETEKKYACITFEERFGIQVKTLIINKFLYSLPSNHFKSLSCIKFLTSSHTRSQGKLRKHGKSCMFVQLLKEFTAISPNYYTTKYSFYCVPANPLY